MLLMRQITGEIKDNKDVERVATISSADPEIGKMIAEAIKKTGENGAITIEDRKSVV